MILLGLAFVVDLVTTRSDASSQSSPFRRTVIAVPAEERRVPLSTLPESTTDLPEKTVVPMGKTFLGYRVGSTISLVSRNVPRLKSLYARFGLCTEICQKLGDGRSQLPQAKIRYSEFSEGSKEVIKQSLIDQLFFNPDPASLSSASFMFVISGQVVFQTGVGNVFVSQDIPNSPSEVAKRQAMYSEHRQYSIVKSNSKNPFDRTYLPELSNSTYRVVYLHEPNGTPDPSLATSLAYSVEKIYKSEKQRLTNELKRFAGAAIALSPKYFEETEQLGLGEQQLTHYKSRLRQQLAGSGLSSQEVEKVSNSAQFEAREYMIHLNIMFNNGISTRSIGPASVYLWP